jgi:hypothetical protein
LHESRAGLNRDQQPIINVLEQNAIYVETAFKRLSAVNIADVRETDLEDIFAILFAKMRYLQDEYSILVVGATSDKETAKLFTQVRKNTSRLTEEAIGGFPKSCQHNTTSMTTTIIRAQ